jgi:hypothetical protein
MFLSMKAFGPEILNSSTKFARNWLYLGVGFRLDKNTSFQTGYMNQWDQVKGNYIKMDIVQFTVQKNFDFSKP